MKLSRVPVVISLALAFAFIPSNFQAADAGLGAQSVSPTAMSITTLTYKVAPQTTTTGTGSGALAFSGINPNTDVYYYYRNTGDIAVTSFTWAVTVTSGPGGNITYFRCPLNTTFTSATKCSDNSTPTSITPGATGPALAVGDYVAIYVNVAKKNNSLSMTSTVSTSQLPAGKNTVS